jgi:hypothetical protein
MQFSLTGWKISFAAAKLSHLVVNDAAWDHGSMVEQVKTIFQQIQRAALRGEYEILKRCTTASGYTIIKDKVMLLNRIGQSMELVAVDIVKVNPGKNRRPDRFCANLKLRKTFGQRKLIKNGAVQYDSIQFWSLIREGDWWMLEEIR